MGNASDPNDSSYAPDTSGESRPGPSRQVTPAASERMGSQAPPSERRRPTPAATEQRGSQPPAPGNTRGRSGSRAPTSPEAEPVPVLTRRTNPLFAHNGSPEFHYSPRHTEDFFGWDAFTVEAVELAKVYLEEELRAEGAAQTLRARPEGAYSLRSLQNQTGMYKEAAQPSKSRKK